MSMSANSGAPKAHTTPKPQNPMAMLEKSNLNIYRLQFVLSYAHAQANTMFGFLAPFATCLKSWSLYCLRALRTSGTCFSTISLSKGVISSKNLSLMSSYHVDMKMPLSGCRMKLSEMLSMMIVLFTSLPSKLRSFTKNGPFCEVCCR